MHLARADFFITLFEVDLRFRKIDQRGLKTSRIYETLKAFFFQKYLWSANLFWRKFHKKLFFQKAFFECELLQSCRYAIFLGTGEVDLRRKNLALLKIAVQNH